jgi:hypothetical protein
MILPVLSGSAPTALAPGLSYPDPIVLGTVGQLLLDRGCTAELANVGGCGELDVRLLVCRTGGAATVELLGPHDGAGQQDHWYAVRVDPQGIRCVWVGPARPCPTEALVAFVDDLLGDDQRSLMPGYTAIG